ncbi:glycogen debranching protein GlgX [Streptomyces sp. NPDC018031]|uniref:glycogen debranching protein GlgX n=1 Tax=Streptomyces sp. NPDC018031 TaxID=3365033 RepID=UPI003797AF4C
MSSAAEQETVHDGWPERAPGRDGPPPAAGSARPAAPPAGPAAEPPAVSVPAPRGGPVPGVPAQPGPDQPLGAWPRPGPDGAPAGTDFALWAGGAEAVEVCLFDEEGRESRRTLVERTDGVWHGFVPGVLPGRRYGYRVHGRWDPWTGARWNPAKLLLDPYARAVDGEFGGPGSPGAGDGPLPPEVYGHVRDWPEQHVADTVRDDRDSAPFVPKGVVVGPAEAGPDAAHRRPRTPWSETVLYELHVRGFTMRHPGVPPELRGSYAGLAHPAALEHLTRLGVTAVELLPVHHFGHEDHLLRRGLRNYWGYNSIGYFAPYSGYAATGTRGQQVGEFRRMVRALHEAGVEVILDVVYNHTAEGGELGPTFSLRGIDNAGHHRLQQDPRRYADVTGCGNTLDVPQPQVLRLIADSLRYWVTEMGVDGFRFDLATALARNADGVDMNGPFLAVLGQDPVLRRVKLIAEPWDVGPGGYRVGGFPRPWAEWNDRYRDAVRDCWRGALPDLRDLGYRLSGSSDLYAWNGRRPGASVNFVTAHDGFTLRDLVSHDRKHNEANGEGNRDGTDDNRSWNCGAEGGTDDPAIHALRARQVRNLLATLLLSTGVPMLVAGDELGRTQGGNNNAYCQDNEVSWLDWGAAAEPDNRALTAFTARLIALRRAHPALRRDAFFTGRPAAPGGLPDLAWFTARGERMTDADWYAPAATIGMFLSGRDLPQRDAEGAPVTDDSFLLVLHTGPDPVDFVPPGAPWAGGYRVVVDTARDDAPAGPPEPGPDAGAVGGGPAGAAPGAPVPAGAPVRLPGRSLLLLRALPAADGGRKTE